MNHANFSIPASIGRTFVGALTDPAGASEGPYSQRGQDHDDGDFLAANSACAEGDLLTVPQRGAHFGGTSHRSEKHFRTLRIYLRTILGQHPLLYRNPCN